MPSSDKPRTRFSKEYLLARFKPTTQLDMTVFVAEIMLDYAEIFATSGPKPNFKSNKRPEDDEKDPFDQMV